MSSAIDCGQEGIVCAIAPGCSRHWEQRNRELVEERDERTYAALMAAGVRGGPHAWRWASDPIGTTLDDDAAWERLLGELRERVAASQGHAAIRRTLEAITEEERLAHAHQLQADIEAEQSGRLALRKRFGARDNETMGMFIERLYNYGGTPEPIAHVPDGEPRQ